jgi:hypothetical protein
MRYIRLFEEFNYKLIDLVNLLKKYNVPVDLWGTGKSKTINHLLKEIENKECSIVEENNTVRRYIEFVGVKVYFTNDDGDRWVLVEERQEFNDGRIRRRNMPNSVSEKMIFGEDPLNAAIRGIKEELGVKVEEQQLSKYKDLHYDGGSVSYPGLDTKYKGHKFICQLKQEQFDENGYIEVQKDKKTFFVWKKL